MEYVILFGKITSGIIFGLFIFAGLVYIIEMIKLSVTKETYKRCDNCESKYCSIVPTDKLK